MRTYITYNGHTYYGALSKLPVSGTLNITGVVSDTAVRVRRGPSTNNSIITELYYGQKVAVIGGVKRNGETWYKVSFKNGSSRITGYMHSNFIKIQ